MNKPRRPLARLLATCATLPLSPWTLAHEGHGLPGTGHWHATDAFGLIATGVVAAAVVWFIRRK